MADENNISPSETPSSPHATEVIIETIIIDNDRPEPDSPTPREVPNDPGLSPMSSGKAISPTERGKNPQWKHISPGESKRTRDRTRRRLDRNAAIRELLLGFKSEEKTFEDRENKFRRTNNEKKVKELKKTKKERRKRLQLAAQKKAQKMLDSHHKVEANVRAKRRQEQSYRLEMSRKKREQNKQRLDEFKKASLSTMEETKQRRHKKIHGKSSPRQRDRGKTRKNVRSRRLANDQYSDFGDDPDYIEPSNTAAILLGSDDEYLEPSPLNNSRYQRTNKMSDGEKNAQQEDSYWQASEETEANVSQRHESLVGKHDALQMELKKMLIKEETYKNDKKQRSNDLALISKQSPKSSSTNVSIARDTDEQLLRKIDRLSEQLRDAHQRRGIRMLRAESSADRAKQFEDMRLQFTPKNGIYKPGFTPKNGGVTTPNLRISFQDVIYKENRASDTIGKNSTAEEVVIQEQVREECSKEPKKKSLPAKSILKSPVTSPIRTPNKTREGDTLKPSEPTFTEDSSGISIPEETKKTIYSDPDFETETISRNTQIKNHMEPHSFALSSDSSDYDETSQLSSSALWHVNRGEMEISNEHSQSMHNRNWQREKNENDIPTQAQVRTIVKKRKTSLSVKIGEQDVLSGVNSERSSRKKRGSKSSKKKDGKNKSKKMKGFAEPIEKIYPEGRETNKVFKSDLNIEEQTPVLEQPRSTKVSAEIVDHRISPFTVPSSSSIIADGETRDRIPNDPQISPSREVLVNTIGVVSDRDNVRVLFDIIDQVRSRDIDRKCFLLAMSSNPLARKLTAQIEVLQPLLFPKTFHSTFSSMLPEGAIGLTFDIFYRWIYDKKTTHPPIADKGACASKIPKSLSASTVKVPRRKKKRVVMFELEHKSARMHGDTERRGICRQPTPISTNVPENVSDLSKKTSDFDADKSFQKVEIDNVMQSPFTLIPEQYDKILSLPILEDGDAKKAKHDTYENLLEVEQDNENISLLVRGFETKTHEGQEMDENTHVDVANEHNTSNRKTCSQSSVHGTHADPVKISTEVSKELGEKEEKNLFEYLEPTKNAAKLVKFDESDKLESLPGSSMKQAHQVATMIPSIVDFSEPNEYSKETFSKMRNMGPINGNKRSGKGSKFVADLESAITISGETREKIREGHLKNEEPEDIALIHSGELNSQDFEMYPKIIKKTKKSRGQKYFVGEKSLSPKEKVSLANQTKQLENKIKTKQVKASDETTTIKEKSEKKKVIFEENNLQPTQSLFKNTPKINGNSLMRPDTPLTDFGSNDRQEKKIEEFESYNLIASSAFKNKYQDTHPIPGDTKWSSEAESTSVKASPRISNNLAMLSVEGKDMRDHSDSINSTDDIVKEEHGQAMGKYDALDLFTEADREDKSKNIVENSFQEELEVVRMTEPRTPLGSTKHKPGDSGDIGPECSSVSPSHHSQKSDQGSPRRPLKLKKSPKKKLKRVRKKRTNTRNRQMEDIRKMQYSESVLSPTRTRPRKKPSPLRSKIAQATHERSLSPMASSSPLDVEAYMEATEEKIREQRQRLKLEKQKLRENAIEIRREHSRYIEYQKIQRSPMRAAQLRERKQAAKINPLNSYGNALKMDVRPGAKVTFKRRNKDFKQTISRRTHGSHYQSRPILPQFKPQIDYQQSPLMNKKEYAYDRKRGEHEKRQKQREIEDRWARKNEENLIRQLEEQKRIMNLRYKVAKERLERRSKRGGFAASHEGTRFLTDESVMGNGMVGSHHVGVSETVKSPLNADSKYIENIHRLKDDEELMIASSLADLPSNLFSKEPIQERKRRKNRDSERYRVKDDAFEGYHSERRTSASGLSMSMPNGLGLGNAGEYHFHDSYSTADNDFPLLGRVDRRSSGSRGSDGYTHADEERGRGSSNTLTAEGILPDINEVLGLKSPQMPN